MEAANVKTFISAPLSSADVNKFAQAIKSRKNRIQTFTNAKIKQ